MTENEYLGNTPTRRSKRTAKTQSIWTGAFWGGTLERAIATFAQTLVALIGVDVIAPIWGLGWVELLGSAVLAALLSVLKSVGAGAFTGTPSVGHVEELAPKPVKPKRGGNDLAPQGREQGM